MNTKVEVVRTMMAVAMKGLPLPARTTVATKVKVVRTTMTVTTKGQSHHRKNEAVKVPGAGVTRDLTRRSVTQLCHLFLRNVDPLGVS